MYANNKTSGIKSFSKDYTASKSSKSSDNDYDRPNKHDSKSTRLMKSPDEKQSQAIAEDNVNQSHAIKSISKDYTASNRRKSLGNDYNGSNKTNATVNERTNQRQTFDVPKVKSSPANAPIVLTKYVPNTSVKTDSISTVTVSDTPSINKPTIEMKDEYLTARETFHRERNKKREQLNKKESAKTKEQE